METESLSISVNSDMAVSLSQRVLFGRNAVFFNSSDPQEGPGPFPAGPATDQQAEDSGQHSEQQDGGRLRCPATLHI